MTRYKRIVLVVMLTVILFAVAVGSPMFILLIGSAVALLVLLGHTSEGPIVKDPAQLARWYRWIIAGAGMFAVGVVSAVIDGPEFSTAGWTIWIMSWASAAVLVLFGVVLAATRVLRRKA